MDKVKIFHCSDDLVWYVDNEFEHFSQNPREFEMKDSMFEFRGVGFQMGQQKHW